MMYEAAARAGRWLRRRRAAFALLLAGALLAACAGLVGPREVALPLARLQQGLERRFPLHHRMLELFDVELTRPQLTLQPGDRVALALDARVAPPFTARAWQGSLGLSGHLVADAARGAIVLGDARVERFAFDGVDASRQRQLARLAGLLLDQLVRDMPLYHFRPEDLRYAGVQFVPGRIVTTPDALVLTLTPVR